MSKITIGIILAILLIIFSIAIACYPSRRTPDPYDPWENENPITCWRCENGYAQSKLVRAPDCPPGWSKAKSDCSKPPIMCWRCTSDGYAEYHYYSSECYIECPPAYPIGPQDTPPDCDCLPEKSEKPEEIRTVTIFGSFVPYNFDKKHGYLPTGLLNGLIREHFNNWKENPYRSGHVCRHMCMEIEEYLETELAIDCLWGTGDKYGNDGKKVRHTWLYILTKDINDPNKFVFYPYESTSLNWRIFNSQTSKASGYTMIDINHGNYIYGKRVTKNGEPYIFRVPNYKMYDYIEDYCPGCRSYLHLYGKGDVNYDVVLPLSIWEQLTMWIIGGGYI